MRKLEILAPARNADIAVRAILAGADAVYIGPESHGARRAAANSVDDIRRVCETAHIYGARVYATVNTIIYDSETESVERLVWRLWQAGVDALIVQDMALLRMHLPPIELHASTQCDIRTPEKARFLASVGFSRLVLPRELSLDEIREIHEAVPDTELEVFVHGALCVSYSGDCRASAMSGGRSANRGECAQICRLPYDLVDSRSNVLVKDRHLLSLRDMNRSQSLREMADAGVMSFKIEGRLKEADYVANAVAYYSRRIDRIIADSDSRYGRLSFGQSRTSFTPDVAKAFNRGFTPYFIHGIRPGDRIASILTPKSIGEKVGTVTRCAGKVIEARLTAELANGDGMGYFDDSGHFCGFRLNRAERSKLFPATPQKIAPGTALYRNRSVRRDAELETARITRTVEIDMALRLIRNNTAIALELTHECGFAVTATATLPEPAPPAATPQERPRRGILTRLGDTHYRARRIVDLAGDRFIPASSLAALRREAVSLLDATVLTRHRFGRRKPEAPDARFPYTELTIHDNVANRLAESFYRSHGVTAVTPAAEVERPEGETEVMCTRYCLRRELGHCLRDPEGREWHGPLYLRNDRLRLRVDFDCSRCGMSLVLAPGK